MTELHLTPEGDIGKATESLEGPATIYLAPGTYRQKIHIKGDGVTLIGAGREATVITFDDYARKLHPDGREYNTFRTETVLVTGDDVTVKDLTIENAAGSPETKGQSIALFVHSKRFYGENLCVSSTQDTLFLSPFPDDLVARYRGFLPEEKLVREGQNVHLFKNCKISGTVDYVFGGARALFDGCEFVSLRDVRGTCYVAAPSHPLAEDVGFVFYKCAFVGGGADTGEVYLARPWRDFGKCVFLGCRTDVSVNPLLFDKWGDTERDKTARFLYSGFSSERPLSPAKWAKEMTKEEADACLSKVEAMLSYPRAVD
ncbi:MAG: pectinesterase family protein [Clostridia bacterium]|nr:pectinesterase family protein [Clostridia bacterium]